jgi:hypothetical protein
MRLRTGAMKTWQGQNPDEIAARRATGTVIFG